MCIIDRALYRQCESQKKEIKELKQELEDFKTECGGTGILLDVLDAYFDSRGLHEDFKKFLQPSHTQQINYGSNKILQSWRELDESKGNQKNNRK